MTKPGRRENTPSNEIARFTDREDQQRVFRRYLHSPTEPPVLMFYGVGGAGKTWLLKKLKQETRADVPTAYLDFDAQAGGQRVTLDPAAALYEIRQQIGRGAPRFALAPGAAWYGSRQQTGRDAPRFDLAFAMLRHKQGAAEEPGMRGHGAMGLAAERSEEHTSEPQSLRHLVC